VCAREEADGKAVLSFFKRVTGYAQPTEKIFVSKDGEVIRVQTEEHIPPDVRLISLARKRVIAGCRTYEEGVSFCFEREVRVSQSLCCSFRYLHSLELRRYPRCRGSRSILRNLLSVRQAKLARSQPVKDRLGVRQ
jgi:hypothetical protein